MDWPEAANLKQEMSLDLKICFHFKTCVSIKTLHILNFISTKAEWQCLGVKRNSVWNWSLNICCKTHSLELKYSPEFLYFSAVMEVCCFSNLCVCICVCVFLCSCICTSSSGAWPTFTRLVSAIGTSNPRICCWIQRRLFSSSVTLAGEGQSCFTLIWVFSFLGIYKRCSHWYRCDVR